MTTLKDLVTIANDFKAKMKADGKAALSGAFKDFFEKHPEASAIVWTQYSPHFNDGDPCVFHLREFELKVDPSKMATDVQKMLGWNADEHDHDEDEEDCDYTDTDYGYGDSCAVNMLNYLTDNRDDRSWSPRVRAKLPARQLTAPEQSLVDDFEELCNACQAVEEVLENVFGDGYKVIATAKGFDTEEWEHD